jgi:HD-GYP domain-containing protein (c-di-GMP phosphodiesterase class II)
MKKALPFLLFLILATVSCGIYTFSASSLGGIKYISIPILDNQTTEYGLAELLTSETSQAFISDNTLKVVPEAQADAILRGAVVSYSREAYTYTAGETVQQYICRIGIKVKLEKADSDKAIWEDNLSDIGIFDAATETEDNGKERAVQKLVDQIINKTVKNW